MSEINSRSFDPYRASMGDSLKKLRDFPLSTEIGSNKALGDAFDSDDESSTKSSDKRVSFEDVLNDVFNAVLEKRGQPVTGSSGTLADSKPGANSTGFSKSKKEWGLQG